jgi:pterin-4a-carbinolamine dehydratase
MLLTTHSAGGLTAKDVALARRADALALKLARD